jgi:hypothetical protein
VSAASPEIVLQLTPAAIVIGVRTNVSQLSFGEMATVQVYVEDAPRLFGLTCELAFDPDHITPLEVRPGSFFGGEGERLFFDDRDLPRAPDRLTLGITRKRGATGVCGSGAAFEVVFYALDPGAASVALVPGENLVLTTPNFETIETSRITIASGATLQIR